MVITNKGAILLKAVTFYQLFLFFSLTNSKGSFEANLSVSLLWVKSYKNTRHLDTANSVQFWHLCLAVLPLNKISCNCLLVVWVLRLWHASLASLLVSWVVLLYCIVCTVFIVNQIIITKNDNTRLSTQNKLIKMSHEKLKKAVFSLFCYLILVRHLVWYRSARGCFKTVKSYVTKERVAQVFSNLT